MLNKELSHFSESSRSGNQISEYICSTFLGKLLLSIGCFASTSLSLLSCHSVFERLCLFFLCLVFAWFHVCVCECVFFFVCTPRRDLWFSIAVVHPAASIEKSIKTHVAIYTFIYSSVEHNILCLNVCLWKQRSAGAWLVVGKPQNERKMF